MDLSSLVATPQDHSNEIPHQCGLCMVANPDRPLPESGLDALQSIGETSECTEQEEEAPPRLRNRLTWPEKLALRGCRGTFTPASGHSHRESRPWNLPVPWHAYTFSRTMTQKTFTSRSFALHLVRGDASNPVLFARKASASPLLFATQTISTMIVLTVVTHGGRHYIYL